MSGHFEVNRCSQKSIHETSDEPLVGGRCLVLAGQTLLARVVSRCRHAELFLPPSEPAGHASRAQRVDSADLRLQQTPSGSWLWHV